MDKKESYLKIANLNMAPIILLSFFLLGNDPEGNCKHLQTDTWVMVFINTNHGKLNRLRLAY